MKKEQVSKRSGWDISMHVVRELGGLLTMLYVVAMVVLLPLFYKSGYDHIGTDKAMFFRRVGVPLVALAALTGLIYLAMVYIDGYRDETEISFWGLIKREMSVTDWFALGYLVILVISYVCSDSNTTSIWGENAWYMGLIPQVTVLSSYFLVSRFLRKGDKWLYSILAVSFVVFLLGLLNRYSVYPINMSSANPAYISTIGNVNWYCGYWSSVFFAGMLLLWRFWRDEGLLKIGEKGNKKAGIVCLILYFIVGVATGLTQGSDSGLLALAVALLILFLISVKQYSYIKIYLLLCILISSVLVIGNVIQKIFPQANTLQSPVYLLLIKSNISWVLFGICIIVYLGLKRLNKASIYTPRFGNTVKNIVIITVSLFLFIYIAVVLFSTLFYSGANQSAESSIFIFNDKWGSNRGATWKAGIITWLRQEGLHKLIGTGPDGMASFIYDGRGKGMPVWLFPLFGEDRLTNAHGEWITILANLGLLGIISFGGMVVSAMIRMIKVHRENIWACACGFCILAYTANNIFSFQQTMNITQMFVILGIGEGILRRMRTERRADEPGNL